MCVTRNHECVFVCVCQFINSMSEVSMIIGGFSRFVSLSVCHQLNVSSDRNGLSIAEEGSTVSGLLISNWKIGFAFDFCCAGSGCGHAISSRGVCSSSALSLHHGQCFNTLPTFPDDHKCFFFVLDGSSPTKTHSANPETIWVCRFRESEWLLLRMSESIGER